MWSPKIGLRNGSDSFVLAQAGAWTAKKSEKQAATEIIRLEFVRWRNILLAAIKVKHPQVCQ